jgi:hypothetical protein
MAESGKDESATRGRHGNIPKALSIGYFVFGVQSRHYRSILTLPGHTLGVK